MDLRQNSTLLSVFFLFVILYVGQLFTTHEIVQESREKDERIAQLERQNEYLVAQSQENKKNRRDRVKRIVDLQKKNDDLKKVIRYTNSQEKRISHYLQTKYNLSKSKASTLAGYFYDAKEQAEKKYKVKLDINILVALTYTESTFDPNAVSPVGAIGIMQVMPRYHLHRFDFIEKVSDLMAPSLNIRAGVFIFAEELNRYGSVRKAIRAYHGGKGGVYNPKPSTVSYEREIMKKLQKLKV